MKSNHMKQSRTSDFIWLDLMNKALRNAPKFHLLWEEGGGKSDIQFSSVQFSSVTQPCPTLCDPMNCSTPGLPVHHQLSALLAGNL